ncbi:hypothetical protein [Microbacterium terricola]|uniref:hypothetical protein n=1 Tax=Microbacterium terricola TaxID=344163 RepID=UPI0021E8EAA1|nr:hypothetical protein [Microbacterium terricola]UYK38867.1 hypothetical protein OAU46_09110 [Microbacterium terricola]
MNRRLAALALAAVMAVGLTACVPDPEPTPSAAGFATEEEAFAAAEATYRAYVDALNQVDLSDPETFEPVFALTTGEANAGARESFSQMHADGWTVEGESRVASMQPLSADLDVNSVAMTACLDVSDVTLVDSVGKSVVDANRPDVQEIRVDYESASSVHGLAISSLGGSEADACD